MNSFLYPLFYNLWLWIPIYLSSLIPLGNASFFEYIILPLLILTFAIEILLKPRLVDFNLLIIIIFGSFIIFQSLLYFTTSVDLGENALILSIRLIGMLLIYYLSFNSINNLFRNRINGKFNSNFEKKLISQSYFPFFILLLVFMSILKAIRSEYFIGIDFPFYTEQAVNRQIFSPAVFLTSLYLFYSYPNKIKIINRNFFASDFILILSASFSFIASILSGSRSWALILIAFLISKIISLIVFENSQLIGFKISYIYKLRNIQIFILGFLSFIATGSYFIRFFSVERIQLIFKRLDSILTLLSNYEADASRGARINQNLDIISRPFTNLFGSFEPKYSLDSAALTLISHYGYLIFLVFIIIIFLISKKQFKRALPISISNVIFIIFGGLVFVTPRVYLLWFAVLNFFIINSRLSSEKKIVK
tara:strand:- start:117 stop:1382 length:1266 start_codon:yes stop_codon:yes gene_type:complete